MRDYRCWILDCRSRHPDLMERMMQHMNVSPLAAARVDGGMAWCEARTKCIFCRRENECARWHEHPEGNIRFPPILPERRVFSAMCSGVERR